MVRLSILTLSFGACVVSASACGLSVTGTATEDGEDASTVGPDGASPSPGDASSDALGVVDGPVTPPVGCKGDACALPTAPGFGLVLFGDATDTCPSGFTSSDAIESPTAGAGACTCGGCTANINCSTGPIPTFYDTGSGTCGTSGAQHQTNNGACRNTNGNFGANASVGAPTAVVTNCAAAGVASRPAVTTQKKRVCTPSSTTCIDDACSVAGTMKACLVADGDLACPPSAPTKHLVGADFTLGCGACTCTLSATCGGKMEFFNNSGCSGSLKSLTVGVCTDTNSSSFQSTKWSGIVASQSCAAQAGAPAVALTGPRTVCCL